MSREWIVKISRVVSYREDVLLTVQIHAVGHGDQVDVLRKLQAAPEMFEALKAMLSAYSLGGRNAQEAKAAARAAIAKAEGKE